LSKIRSFACLKHPAIVAPVAVGLATFIRLSLESQVHDQGIFFLFAIAVVIAALYGGRWAGIAATFLSMPVCVYLFVEPRYTWLVHDIRGTLVMLVLFAALCLLCTGIIHRSQSTSTRLKQSLADLQRSEAALEKHTEELMKLNDGLERFAYAASHDLRDPLFTIGTGAELVTSRAGERLDPESTEALASIVRSVERMKRLIRDILDFAQAGTAFRERNPEIDSHAVAQLAIANLGHAIQQSGAKVLIDELPRVCASEEAILRLFQNLIGNAIKYHGEKPPQIYVSFLQRHREWVFTIQDNGIGIDRKYHAKIFEPFCRLHGQSQYEGSGLGLSVCERIVQALGGRIWVESTAGEGSTFLFTIPRPSDETIEVKRKPMVIEFDQSSWTTGRDGDVPLKVRRAANGGDS
jgi:signal transduction histidine kinase